MDELRKKPEYTLIEHDDYWVLPLGGNTLVSMIIGHALKMEFVGLQDEEATIWIGGELQLTSKGTQYKMRGDVPSSLAPVLGLCRSVVDSAVTHKDGRLEITFRNGENLCAYPLADTESWEVTGERSLRVVCMPGGDLAVWEPDPSDLSTE
jgi:hypothetical protein